MPATGLPQHLGPVVTSSWTSPGLHPNPHLHPVDDPHDAILTGNGEDLLSGLLSSTALELHLKNLPWAEQGLATPPVELLLSSLTTWLVQRGLLPTTSKKASPLVLTF